MAFGATGEADGNRPDMTLQRAMEVVLLDREEMKATVKQIATEVNERQLYRMRDGRPVEPGQIHARANNYAEFFKKIGPVIGLRYTFITSAASTNGGYWRAYTDVARVADCSKMTFETRVAYSVAIPSNQTADEFTAGHCDDRARKAVLHSGFVPGATDRALLTTTGWKELDVGS